MICTYLIRDKPRVLLLSQLPYGTVFKFKRSYKLGEYYSRSQPSLSAMYKRVTENTFYYKTAEETVWDVSGMNVASAIKYLNDEIELI